MCKIHRNISGPISVKQLNIGKKDGFPSFVKSQNCKSYHSDPLKVVGYDSRVGCFRVRRGGHGDSEKGS